MVKRSILLIILGVFFLSRLTGCVGSTDIPGCYTAIGTKNTYDTIIIRNNHTYSRRIYSKGNKLLSEMRGSWKEVGDAKIYLDSFFLNLDRDLLKYPELLKDNDSGMEVVLEWRSGKVTFCTGYYQDENCYQKLADKP